MTLHLIPLEWKARLGKQASSQKHEQLMIARAPRSGSRLLCEQGIAWGVARSFLAALLLFSPLHSAIEPAQGGRSSFFQKAGRRMHRKRIPRNSTDSSVITDIENPKFDLEKLIEHYAKSG